MSRARGWQRLSLRARLMVIGVLGVAVALALGSLALYGVLTLVSFRSLDNTADATASQVADLVNRNRLPDPIPVTGSQIVQVLDSRNRVVSASINGDRLTAVVTPGEVADARMGRHPQVPGSRVGLDSSLRISAAKAGPADARRTVVVAQRIDDIQRQPAGPRAHPARDVPTPPPGPGVDRLEGHRCGTSTRRDAPVER